MKDNRKLIILIIVAIVIIALIGVLVYNGVNSIKDETKNPVATFELQDYGTIKMELYPQYAPNTVANMIALIEAGYYNGKVIYGKDDICLYMARNAEEDSKGPTISAIDNTVEADSEGDYEYQINGEFVANDFEQNTLRHEKGMISLNRSDYSTYGLTQESYNSGSAQFSVMMQDSSNLNGVYCVFGKVVEGLDILEKIYQEAQVAESEDGEENATAIKEFAVMPVITNATVEKYGVDYGKPEIHEAFDIQAYINELYSQYYSN